jgi:arginyl-tRNA--protein-N-Asp/Glu arginylyltransferase
MSYLNWDTQIITDFSPENIEALYDEGYVFTRVDRGVMNKTRSFRVDLSRFELSSENRRILRKVESLVMSVEPIPYKAYDWKIGKMAKDFYEKFGDAIFTANKAKEIMTDATRSNFNTLLVFKTKETHTIVGYAICYASEKIIHYSFPFYLEESSRGLGMMTMMLDWAKTSGKSFAYLGSLQRPSDTYKLQFAGGEWFDGEHWQTDITPLKSILK